MSAWNRSGTHCLAKSFRAATSKRTWRTVYQRLRLPEGRLELMTGIRQRRFWSPNTLPSEISLESGERAIQAAGIDRSEIERTSMAPFAVITWNPLPPVASTTDSDSVNRASFTMSRTLAWVC